MLLWGAVWLCMPLEADLLGAMHGNHMGDHVYFMRVTLWMYSESESKTFLDELEPCKGLILDVAYAWTSFMLTALISYATWCINSLAKLI